MEIVSGGAEQGEYFYTGEELIAIRDFCIKGLAMAVPEFLARDKAADMLGEWFPGDEVAVASLYRRIAEQTPRVAA